MTLLDDIQAREAAATPHPWFSGAVVGEWQRWAHIYPSMDEDAVPIILLEDVEEPDVEFIAHARQDIPALLAVAQAATDVVSLEPAALSESAYTGEALERLKRLVDALAPLLASEEPT